MGRGLCAQTAWHVRFFNLGPVQPNPVPARDRLGIKPLYYTQTAQGWLFASEVQTLLATGLVEAHLNHDMLSHYLIFYAVPPPATLLTGIWAHATRSHSNVANTRAGFVFAPT